jgi:predicted site-specific integrase-resolvase
MALMSPKVAAARLLISVKTLMGHVRDGGIRYVNVGRSDRRPRYAFSDSDLAEFETNRSRRNVGGTYAARSTSSTFNGEVVAFTALRNKRVAAKPSG